VHVYALKEIVSGKDGSFRFNAVWMQIYYILVSRPFFIFNKISRKDVYCFWVHNFYQLLDPGTTSESYPDPAAKNPAALIYGLNRSTMYWQFGPINGMYETFFLYFYFFWRKV
jgi:hypothetical protein